MRLLMRFFLSRLPYTALRPLAVLPLNFHVPRYTPRGLCRRLLAEAGLLLGSQWEGGVGGVVENGLGGVGDGRNGRRLLGGGGDGGGGGCRRLLANGGDGGGGGCRRLLANGGGVRRRRWKKGSPSSLLEMSTGSQKAPEEVEDSG